jgi:DNA invertase Pin-like site-specific DNA recombinase
MADIIGYARTSTTEQLAGFEAQVRDLEAAGCRRVFREQVSSVASRAELTSTLKFLQPGDVLVVTKLDRLARSMRDLLEIVAKIEARGASLRILAMNLDTGSATGKLMLNVLGSVAEFERSIMLERQREGIAKAKTDGKYRGRNATPDSKRNDVLNLYALKVPVDEIAKQLSISRATVFRIVKPKQQKIAA